MNSVDIASWMAATLTAGPADALPPEQPPPVTRRWAARSSAEPGAASAILACHPDMAPYLPGTAVEPPGRSPRSMRGRQSRLASLKAGRTIRSANSLQAHHVTVCEIDPEVVRVIENPVRVLYVVEGRRHISRPPLAEVRREGVTICAVHSEADAGRNEARWAALGPVLAAAGFTFQVLTERHIHREPRWGSVRTIMRERHAPLPDDDTVAAMRLAAQTGPSTIGALADRHGVSRAQVHALVRRGVLSVDLERPLADTLVSPGWATDVNCAGWEIV